MQSKYNRSFSGLPDNTTTNTSNNGTTNTTTTTTTGGTQQGSINDKLSSIYTQMNSQRLVEQREQRKHHQTLYDLDVQQKYIFKQDPQIKRALNQEKVKRSLNIQDNFETDKENINITKKNYIKAIEKPLVCVKQKYDHRIVENDNLLLHYSDDILDYIKLRETQTTPVMCLDKHNIPANLRAKMVDWMIEVLASYKCTEQTFFLAVRIMDKFLQQTDKIHDIQDLHLTGVTSMFIACKYEEIYPMKLQVVHDKIAHKKLSIESIKRKESEILQTIGFNMVGGTIYEVFNHLLVKVGFDRQLEAKIYNYMKKICVYLAKMILYEYELVNSNDCFILSGSLIFVAFKIIEQLQPSFKSEIKIKEIVEVANLSNDKLIEIASKVLNLAKGFDKQFPNLENLKKFNGFQMEDLEEDDKKKQP